MVFSVLLPAFALAKEVSPENYGAGLLCPRTDAQVSFYTEDNQQDASGTLAYETVSGYALASDRIKTLYNADAHLMDGFCEGGAPGIRIDAKRDGWLQAGSLWLPPNQEWDYADWQDYLRKAAVWKPLGPVTLYKGAADAPDKEKSYPQPVQAEGVEIYPLKFTDDGYALVVLDEKDAFAKNCTGSPQPPEGALGWIRMSGDDGRPAAVPQHPKGC